MTVTHVRVCPECGDRRKYAGGRKPRPGALCFACNARRNLPAKGPRTPYVRVCPECGDRHEYRPGSAKPAPGNLCRSCARALGRRSALNYQAYVDEMAVQRLIFGGMPVRATAAERREAVKTLDRQRLTASQIATRIGCTTRTVQRARARIRQEDQAA